MSTTVTTFKFFWAHEDERQEAWLRSMAQQGLHLVKVNPLCFWTFRRGEPADIVYRIDFPGASQDPAFRQLMHDAGWALATTSVGWYYWRIPVLAGEAPELFSDNASKAGKFQQRLTLLLGSAIPVFVIFTTADKGRMLEQLSLPFLVPMCVILALYVLVMPYTLVRLMLRIRKLREALPA